jgi:hypothetical protein
LLGLLRTAGNAWVDSTQSSSIGFRLHVEGLCIAFTRSRSFSLKDALHHFWSQLLLPTRIEVRHLVRHWRRVYLRLQVSRRTIFLDIWLNSSVFVEILKSITWSWAFQILRRNRFGSRTSFWFEPVHVILESANGVASLGWTAWTLSRLFTAIFFEVCGTLGEHLVSTGGLVVIRKLDYLVVHGLVLLGLGW